MDFDEAARIVGGIPVPHTSASRGRVLYEHIRGSRPENLLELGTARGGSAVFMAAALEANGDELLAEGEEMPTADELAAQFEQFLADQQRGSDDH